MVGPFPGVPYSFGALRQTFEPLFVRRDVWTSVRARGPTRAVESESLAEVCQRQREESIRVAAMDASIALLGYNEQSPSDQLGRVLMSTASTLQSRIDNLRSDLEADRKRYTRLARLNYRFAYVLMIGTLLASGVAGIGGLVSDDIVVSKWMGAIALLPALFALVASVLKLQGRANWHY
jgi:hypothetical protein